MTKGGQELRGIMKGINHGNITYTRNGEVSAKKGGIEAGTNVPGRAASLIRTIPM